MSSSPTRSHTPAAFSPCPLCGADQHRTVHVEDWITIYQCASCEFMFTRDRSGDFRGDRFEKEIDSFYRWLKEFRRERVGLLKDRLSRLAGQMSRGAAPKTILEIGSGGGAILDASRQLGFHYTGLEPFLATRFQGHQGADESVEVLPCRLEDFETDRRFDLVVMDNVLEHLADPVWSLKRVRELLQPGGVCWVQVPNEANLILKHRILSLLKDRWITFPGHVNLFTRKTLSHCFVRAGMEIPELTLTSASDPVLTRLLLMRPPGLMLAAVMAFLRATRADVAMGWAYWIDGIWTKE